MREIAINTRLSVGFEGYTVNYPLAKGLYTKISVDDYDYVKQFLWNRSDTGYAVRKRLDKTKKSGFVISRLHRELMERILGRTLAPDELIDHRNGDRLDNRRENLRLATAAQNSHNLRKRPGFTSRYKGVSWDKSRDRWKVEIRCEQSRLMVGRFDDEDEAGWMRDQWSIALHGDYSVLNFDYQQVEAQF